VAPQRTPLRCGALAGLLFHASFACAATSGEEDAMSLLLLLVLVILLVSLAPAWPYSREWGYGPSGAVGAVVVVLVVLALLGRI
jgi:hypothetical protein